MRRLGIAWVMAVLAAGTAAAEGDAAAEAAALRAEVHSKGWIVYSARSGAGDMDLFLCRPDGSAVTNITRTPGANEAWPRFSHDGRQLLYRRLPRDQAIDGNRYGEQGEPIVARANGTAPRRLGGDGELPWANWGPDDRQLLCLAVGGFAIVDTATAKPVRALPRHGFFQQPAWSPDGRWFIGVANAFGTSWSIGRMDAATGAVAPVNTVDCCTPDWFPDSRHVIFSWRSPDPATGRSGTWTQLWRADVEGTSRQLVYAEEGRHLYGGFVSPDGAYVLFTGNMQEDGDPSHDGAPMGLMRLADGPMVGGASEALRTQFPAARRGPVISLPVGWEPSWTFSEAPAGAAAEGASR